MNYQKFKNKAKGKKSGLVDGEIVSLRTENSWVWISSKH